MERDIIGWSWQDWLPHVIESIEQGEFEMGIFESRPLTVRQVVEHWTIQASDNPLYSDEEKSAITATVQVIQGKNKKDALQSLQEQINSHDGMSYEACFARIFSRKLKYGE